MTQLSLIIGQGMRAEEAADNALQQFNTRDTEKYIIRLETVYNNSMTWTTLIWFEETPLLSAQATVPRQRFIGMPLDADPLKG